MIKSLPKEVQAQLRSGVAIFSLQQCVEELILNSIDAGATCVAVKIDIEACKVQVIDNGSGMCQEDMEKVGIRYNTSKCSTLEDLENLRFYGFRGEAISSIVSLAEMVEISSRTKLSVKTYVKGFNEGRGLDVCEAQTVRPSAGTTVSIYNLFYTMPVRRKRMDHVLETERIRQRVEAISLMQPSVSFTVKKDNSAHMMVQLSKTSSSYYRFVQIHGLSRAQKLGEVSYTHEQFEMTGHIGREGHYNNSLQFLFVNGRLLLKTRIHKMLNCLLKRVSSAARQNNSPTLSPLTSSPKQRGGTDLHGVYMLNIKCHYSEYDICLEPAKSLIEFKDWDNVLICIEEGVKSFLTKENLVTEFSMNDTDHLVSVFDNPTNSPGRKVKTLAAVRNLKKIAEDTSSTTHEGFEALTENKDNTNDLEVCGDFQMLEQVSSNTASYSKEAIQGGDFPEQTTLSTATELNNNCKGDHILECHKNANYPNMNNSDSPVSFNNNKVSGSKSQISILDEKGEQDSLQKFSLPNKVNPPKRILPLNDTERDLHSCHSFYGTSSKTVRMAPCHKLTLSFETGSLDKFKRLFGKNAEKKQKNKETTSVLQPESSLSGCSIGSTLYLDGLVTTDCKKQENNIDKLLLRNSPFTLSEHTSSKCSTESSPWNKGDKIALAAKCSHLKRDKVALIIPQHEQSHKVSRDSDLLISADLSSPVVQVDSHFREMSSVDPIFNELEKSPFGHYRNTHNVDRENNVLFDFSGAVDSVLSDPSKDLQHIAVIEEDTQILASTSEDSNLNKNMTSSWGSLSFGDEPGLTSQHDPQSHNTGIEGQTTNESHENDKAIPTFSNWLAHYDSSLGKLVYINQVTGLSKYNSPVEETQIACTTDVTNMAVSVVSKTEDVQGPNSLSTLFSEWINPVFIRPPEVAVDVTSGQAEGLAVKIHNILFPYRFTKNMIHTMRVINQVDKKFIACLINTTEEDTSESSENKGNLLVLVDQHAAHERVRLEGLVTDSFEDDPDTPGKKRLCSSSVTPPLEISITEEEMRLLRSYQAFLRDIALDVSFPKSESLNVSLERLPTCFTEKESIELRRGRRSVIKTIAEDYLREHIELLRSTGRVRGTLPLTVHNVLASQACHGAIKFNHILSKEECCSLVSSLSSCQLPFQCAHGRPSIVPLADLHHLEDQQDPPKPNLKKLRRMYKSWQLYGQTKPLSQNKA
ncbi:DNA mismatch repair protein Mlh3-like isoform X2 [Myxocyprinus asiaticus]|uniref:DNA mismatch repair protein Mlh3-like isoform X2 n=1 Tax=Myxocyprinus asiaticus TaxID=70543 RepID=UPI00222335AF|nr:DNA mismatch repair protein Mlh3-like isoform X2 [Myxocyprinus asiaticus]